MKGLSGELSSVRSARERLYPLVVELILRYEGRIGSCLCLCGPLLARLHCSYRISSIVSAHKVAFHVQIRGTSDAPMTGAKVCLLLGVEGGAGVCSLVCGGGSVVQL